MVAYRIKGEEQTVDVSTRRLDAPDGTSCRAFLEDRAASGSYLLARDLVLASA